MLKICYLIVSLFLEITLTYGTRKTARDEKIVEWLLNINILSAVSFTALTTLLFISHPKSVQYIYRSYSDNEDALVFILFLIFECWTKFVSVVSITFFQACFLYTIAFEVLALAMLR